MNVTNMNYQILQTLLVLIFLLQTAGSDRELSLDREGGGGSLRGYRLNQTNSMLLVFFTTFNIYIENARCGGRNLPIPAGSTLVHFTF
jgi:hypothetical protein